jgi:hypothetical protein
VGSPLSKGFAPNLRPHETRPFAPGAAHGAWVQRRLRCDIYIRPAAAVPQAEFAWKIAAKTSRCFSPLMHHLRLRDYIPGNDAWPQLAPKAGDPILMLPMERVAVASEGHGILSGGCSGLALRRPQRWT